MLEEKFNAIAKIATKAQNLGSKEDILKANQEIRAILDEIRPLLDPGGDLSRSI